MKRWARLEVRLVALSLVTLAAVGARGQAQEPKTVRIDTLGVMDTLYHLSGGGGNSLAFIDEINGGVVLVDTKRPGWGQPVRDALDGVTDLPVTTIINTHAHPDHAGSNGEFGTAVEIVAHENTKANMARMDLYSGTNAASLPTKTFADRLSLLEGIDRIDLYHFGPAHTDGDVIVVFPEKGVAFLDGHVRAFAHFGGVPLRLVYDNLSAAVCRRVGGERQLTARFQALVSHYLFEPCFARPGEGHEKGSVESRGKGIRLAHMSPVPQGRSLEEIAQCVLASVDAAHSNRARWQEEQATLRELPLTAFEASAAATGGRSW